MMAVANSFIWLTHLSFSLQEIDMALGPTSITEAREKAIDFTVPFDYEPWDILIPASIISADLTAYLFPFGGTVCKADLFDFFITALQKSACMINRVYNEDYTYNVVRQ